MAERIAFIDTNILLAVYSYSDGDPIRLNRILELINSGKLKLFLTEQIIDEFYRNRENKLSVTLKDIEAISNNSFKVPAFCSEMSEVKEIKINFEKIKILAKKVLVELNKHSINRSLYVDKLF